MKENNETVSGEKTVIMLSSIFYKLCIPLFCLMLLTGFITGLIYSIPWYFDVLFIVAAAILGLSCLFIYKIRLEIDFGNKTVVYCGLRTETIKFADIDEFIMGDYSIFRAYSACRIKSKNESHDIVVMINFTSKRIRKRIKSAFERIQEIDYKIYKPADKQENALSQTDETPGNPD